MSEFDSMSGFDQGSKSIGDTAPLTSSTTTQPPSSGSNRDSLNLDDFEKVEADQLLGGPPTSSISTGIGNVAETTQATAVGLVDDIMAQVTNSGQDLFSNFTSTGLPSASETKVESKLNPLSDPFKIDEDLEKDKSAPIAPSSNMFSSELISSTADNKPTSGSGLDIGFTGIQNPASDDFTTDFMASAPPPPSSSLFDDMNSKPQEKISSNDFDDFLAKSDKEFMQDFSIPDIKDIVKDASQPLLESSSPFSAAVSEPSPVEPVKRDPSPDYRNPTPPRTPTTTPLQDLTSPKQPTPPRTPTPPPREPTPTLFKEPTPPLLTKQPTPPRTPTPPPREPTPPLREPTPPVKVPTPREPTPPPREPTPPPREPTPPPREPTPPPREPTPPPREPTPPPREPTPPPREPTPPPREPTPPPREPTPPPKKPPTPPREPTPPPREPTPPPKVTPVAPRTPTPPPVLVKNEVPTAPIQEATVSPGRSYTVSTATKNAFNVFKPLVDLIYWHDVKKTGIVFGSLMVVLLSLAYLSLISVVAYTSLAVLTGTITFRVYKNIMQAVQKSQDGHPFKCILEMDTDLPSDKVHEATDVIVSQINSTISELKRLFLVEDLVDSVKFGCLLWCLTYLGSWFNGLTLVILAVVALFSLPKVYEQNQTQIDQYVGLVRTQVNDVMAKVKSALPIGNKEKAQ